MNDVIRENLEIKRDIPWNNAYTLIVLPFVELLDLQQTLREELGLGHDDLWSLAIEFWNHLKRKNVWKIDVMIFL